ncbi:MAG TPA: response regulator [Chitinophagaceae bacterium]|jgi:CheY-like chemotaxis protein
MIQSTEPKSIVLYADDDPEDRELVIEAFDPYTHHVEVITFPEGKSLLEYLRRLPLHVQAPCLVILDINMPLVNGRECLQQLRQLDRFGSVPVVLFTTSSMPHDREFARRHNAGFITKPTGITELERITEEFISHCNDEIKEKIQQKFI